MDVQVGRSATSAIQACRIGAARQHRLICGAAGVEAWQHEAHSFGESDLLVACETRLAPEDKNGDEHHPHKVNHQKNEGFTAPVRD